jgi:hypothetical protein
LLLGFRGYVLYFVSVDPLLVTSVFFFSHTRLHEHGDEMF